MSGPKLGEAIEVQWPCCKDDEVAYVWLRARVLEARQEPKAQFLLRFEDGSESWNSLRKLAWRAAELLDLSGFVHCFELEEEYLTWCDSLHGRREQLGDKTRGDCAYGEALSGALVSVLIRRDALPEAEREIYNRLHQRCIQELPKAWPGWIQHAAGRAGRARPPQDLRVLQYFEHASFKAHVDSSWPCQALIYLNDDFQGGHTDFPNLNASYRPRRGRVLLWRSVCVGFKSPQAGSLEAHPARHVAREVSQGVKRVVSLNFVLA